MLVWTDNLSTGDPRIDEEHREIFRRMNELGQAINAGADDTTLTRLVEVLLDYAHQHFLHEERAMACNQCPHRDSNCKAHQRFSERLRFWLMLANSSELPRSMIYDLHAETTAWIQHHIAHLDIHLHEAVHSAKPFEMAH